MIRVLLLSILSLLFFSNSLFSEENEPKKVLLIYEKTKFKNSLIEKMEKLLKEKKYDVVKALHGKKEPIKNDVEKFDAVFVTNSGALAKVRPWIIAWLDSNEQYGSKIFVHTTQKNEKETWVPKIKVDGITSASNIKKVDEFAEDFVEKIVEIANKDDE